MGNNQRIGILGATLGMLVTHGTIARVEGELSEGVRSRFRQTPELPVNDELHLQKASEKRARKAAKRLRDSLKSSDRGTAQ